MKNKRGNVAVITIIIVIVAITAGVTGWRFAKKSQVPVQQVVVQPAPVAQTQQVPQNTTPAQSTQPIVNLNKTTKEEAGKKFNHVAVEYKKTASADKKIIHDFVNEVSADGQTQYDPQYEISYLSPKYLVVSSCGGMAPCSETLFDLDKLQEVKLQFPMNLGSYAFYENEKYVAFQGIGRVAQPGISIEMIDGKKVYCLISQEEVFDVVVKNGVMSFTEDAIVPGKDGVFKDVTTKKDINIADFCKNK